MTALTPKTEEAQKRKEAPVFSGCVDYFPDALTAVGRLSKIGNDQHNPGTKLHWDRSKSGDEADALMRHLIDHKRNRIDTDGVPHVVKVAWRALALAQKDLEDYPWAGEPLRCACGTNDSRGNVHYKGCALALAQKDLEENPWN